MVTIPATTFYYQQVNVGDSPIDANWILDADGVFAPTAGLRYLVRAFGQSDPLKDAVIINDTSLVMSIISDRTMDEGATSTFTPTISAGTNPVFSISGPSWASINPTTGLVTLAPVSGNNGSYSITVSASNTCGTVSRTFNTTVSIPAAGVSIADTQAMIVYNDARFPTIPFALSRPILSISASNFTFNANSSPSMIDRVMNAITTTKTQSASSGATNPSIKTQYDTALAGANFDPGDYLLASTSGNGMNSATDYPAQYDTNYNAIFPNHAGKMIWTSGSNGADVWTQSLTWEYEKVPEQFVMDLRRVFGMVANKPGAPANLLQEMRFGGMPPTATLGTAPFNLVDNISNNPAHLNDDGQREISNDLIRRVRALDGGQPYILGQEMLVPFGSTNGAVLGTVLTLGTVTTWSIVGGNSDGIVSINSSGQIVRTAASLSTFDGVREVFVRAQNASGEHIGRIMLMDGQPATLHNAPTARCTSYLRRQTAEFGTNLENWGNQISFAMRYRVPANLSTDVNFMINRCLPSYIVGNGGIIRFNGTTSGGVRLTMRDIDGNSILSWTGVAPTTSIEALGNFVTNDWITLLFSFDNTVNGASVNNARYVQARAGAARTAIPGAAVTMTTQTARPIIGNWYLSNQPLTPVAGNDFDVDFCGFWQGYKDWSVKANRDLFFDESGGRLPVGFPLNGDLSGNGLTPVYFMAGGCGEFAVGHNRVAGSKKQLPQPQLSKALAVASRSP